MIVVGRILKRHHYSKNMIFYDIVIAPETGNSSFEHLLQNSYSFASISVQRDSGEDSFPKAVVGDVVRVSGFVHNVEEFHNRTQRLSLDVAVQNVQVLDSFADSESATSESNSSIHSSLFSFDKIKMGQDFQTYALVELPIPTMAIQVALKQLERFSVAFRDILGDKFELRESSTGYTTSSDRLLIFRAKMNESSNPAALQDLYQTTVASIVSNTTLGPAVLRLYPGHCGLESSSFCCARLLNVVDQLANLVVANLETVFRLQCYPRAVMSQLLDVDQSQKSRLPLHPTQYTHVAYVYLCDGVFIVSAVPRAHCFIGDLREKTPSKQSTASTSTAAEGSSSSNITICRAGAKIEEIMRRKHWIYDDEHGEQPVLHRYRLALDVGASPGGWSYFLAMQSHVERIVAIDKGELRLPLPWPRNVYYWPVLGEEAVNYLRSLSSQCKRKHFQQAEDPHEAEIDVKSPPVVSMQQCDNLCLFESDEGDHLEDRMVDLYCCDANIPPTATTAILLQCVRHAMLADNARVILTFKNPYGKKDAWKQSVQESWQQLTDTGFQEIEELHLLANTAKETTITAIYRPSIPNTDPVASASIER